MRQNPQKLGIEEHHHVKYIFHEHGAWAGGWEWILPSMLNLEHVGDTILLPRKAKKPSAGDGPDLQSRSLLLCQPASDPVPLWDEHNGPVS